MRDLRLSYEKVKHDYDRKDIEIENLKTEKSQIQQSGNSDLEEINQLLVDKQGEISRHLITIR